MMKSILFKNSIIYGGGAAFPVAMSFFLLPLYTHFLTPKDYGILSVIEVLCSLLEIVCSMGTQQSLFRLMHDYIGEERKAFIGSVYLFTCIFSLGILFLMTLLGCCGIELFREISFFPYVFMGIAISAFLAQKMVPLRILQIEERAGSFVSLNIADAVLRAGFVVIFVVIFHLGVIGYLWGKLLALMTLFPVCIRIVNRSCKWCLNAAYIKAAVAFGLPLTPGLACSWILSSSDRFIMERYLPASDIGIYAIAAKMVSVITLITSSIYSAYAPYYFRVVNTCQKDDVRTDVQLKQLNTVYILVAMFCVFALIVVATPALKIIVSSDFWSARVLIPPLAIPQVFLALQGIYHLGIYQAKKSQYVSFSMIIGALVAVVCNILFVQRWGVIAIPVVDGLSILIMVILERMYCRKCRKMEFYSNRLFIAGASFLVLGFIGGCCNGTSLTLDIILRLIIVAVGAIVFGVLFIKEIKRCLGLFIRNR